MKTYLVTGAGGFIGSHIASELSRRGNTVVAVDDLSGCLTWGNLADLDPNWNIKTTAFDCSSLSLMQTLFEKFGPIDTVVHCAANAREGASQFQPHSICSRNVLATSAVISAAIKHGCKNFVFFSSMSVYGKQEPPFHESLPKAPVDVYGVNKAACEAMIEILCEVHGINYAIIRPHNVFGENQALHDKHRNVVAIFMNRILRNEPLFIYGDGEQTRAFSYIHDSLPSFLKVIEGLGVAPAMNRLVVNIGGKKEISVNLLAASVIKAMGVAGTYPIVYYADRPREVRHAFSTFALSEVMLGYEEKVGWEQGIHQMANWAKQHGPVDWVNTEKLEIVNELVPKPWLED